ncbi:hypothetical protein GT347_27195 (plasmid) [Xylophilus rhododendri]|uniref:Uncharacterized protein n=1 Tax=Xylophilus rhododendri TaxID=2697032 RepID=A0A857JGF3_9BURK|nr:hypothetical protein [Xylophilus rhododendri]QHJ01746.1 hypothetical protein GT347_27195 [Xylophilus rhododendri]
MVNTPENLAAISAASSQEVAAQLVINSATSDLSKDLYFADLPPDDQKLVEHFMSSYGISDDVEALGYIAEIAQPEDISLPPDAE